MRIFHKLYNHVFIAMVIVWPSIVYGNWNMTSVNNSTNVMNVVAWNVTLNMQDGTYNSLQPSTQATWGMWSDAHSVSFRWYISGQGDIKQENTFTGSGNKTDTYTGTPATTNRFWYTHVQWTNTQPTWAIVETVVTTNGVAYYPTNSWQSQVVRPFGSVDFWYTNTTTGGWIQFGDQRQNDTPDYQALLTEGETSSTPTQSSSPTATYNDPMSAYDRPVTNTNALDKGWYNVGVDSQVYASAAIEKAIRDQISNDTSIANGLTNVIKLQSQAHMANDNTHMLSISNALGRLSTNGYDTNLSRWLSDQANNETNKYNAAMTLATNADSVARGHAQGIVDGMGDMLVLTNSLGAGGQVLIDGLDNAPEESWGVIQLMGTNALDLKKVLNLDNMGVFAFGSAVGFKTWFRAILVWAGLIGLFSMLFYMIRKGIFEACAIPQIQVNSEWSGIYSSLPGVNIGMRTIIVISAVALVATIPSLVVVTITNIQSASGIADIASTIAGGGGVIPACVSKSATIMNEAFPLLEYIVFSINYLMATWTMDGMVAFCIVYGRALGV